MFRFPWFRRRKADAQESTVPSPAPAPAEAEQRERTIERGWLISSVDLHSGLQVTERDDESTIPSELDRLPPAGKTTPRR